MAAPIIDYKVQVLALLAYKGQTDPACIAEVMQDCANNKLARAYYVGKWKSEVAAIKEIA